VPSKNLIPESGFQLASAQSLAQQLARERRSAVKSAVAQSLQSMAVCPTAQLRRFYAL
jgi:hypothetical protein